MTEPENKITLYIEEDHCRNKELAEEFMELLKEVDAETKVTGCKKLSVRGDYIPTENSDDPSEAPNFGTMYVNTYGECIEVSLADIFKDADKELRKKFMYVLLSKNYYLDRYFKRNFEYEMEIDEYISNHPYIKTLKEKELESHTIWRKKPKSKKCTRTFEESINRLKGLGIISDKDLEGIDFRWNIGVKGAYYINDHTTRLKKIILFHENWGEKEDISDVVADMYMYIMIRMMNMEFSLCGDVSRDELKEIRKGYPNYDLADKWLDTHASWRAPLEYTVLKR